MGTDQSKEAALLYHSIYFVIVSFAFLQHYILSNTFHSKGYILLSIIFIN